MENGVEKMMENKTDQEFEQLRAEYYRLSAEADRRYTDKTQEFIQEIRKIPVKEPTDNPTRVETVTLITDIHDFVSSQFAVINEMGEKAKGFTVEMSLTHSALIAMLKAIRAEFELKINEFDTCSKQVNDNTKEQAKALMLKEHPNASTYDFDNHPAIKNIETRRQKRTELLRSDWLGFIDWQIETVQAWLKWNTQDPDTMYDNIVKKTQSLLIEIQRLDAEFYKNADKSIIREKVNPIELNIKRDKIEKKTFGYDTEQLDTFLEHLQLLIEAGKETPPTTQQPEMLQLSENKPQLYKLELTRETEERVLQNFNFWQNLDTKRYYINIFKDITQTKFCDMVESADFSELNKKGITQRLKYNVYILTRILGNEWGNNAAAKLNTTLSECQKRTEFAEYEKLKSMFLQ
jgi:hypothetical protein